jgi:hypothetical protein
MRFESSPKVLILTPVKNAAHHLSRYAELIEQIEWPRAELTIGILESDSSDSTMKDLQALYPRLSARAQTVTILKEDFGFHIPFGLPRWAPALQLARRATLARSRNRLLFGALRNEDWVLWIDVDVIDYPPDTIARLLSEGRDILQPHCVLAENGPSFDGNAWTDGGTRTMHDLRGTHGAVRLDSVGGTMLLVRADLHRDGLIFPPFRYGLENSGIRRPHPLWGAGEIETEGLAMMARDMGYQCWGLPDFEIIHAKE